MCSATTGLVTKEPGRPGSHSAGDLMHLDTGTTAFDALNRRAWLGITASGLAGIACGAAVPRQAPGLGPSGKEQAANRGQATRFQIACMTLPYSRFPLDRALTGIKAAGYDYVAWGTTHKEGAAQVPVIAADAPPAQAKELGKKCRDLGLEPLMMFSGVYPEAQRRP